jgi:hypothetical protein
VTRHTPSFVLLAALSLSFLAILPAPAQSYIGPGSGVEFIPQFLALLAFIGTAAGAILLWPFFTILRFIREKKDRNNVEDRRTTIVPVPETSGEASHDKR